MSLPQVGGPLPSGTTSLPLVCTHGWKHDRSAWTPLIEYLPDDQEVITWDLPYHGEGGALDRPDEPPRAELVERLDQLIGERESVIVVGHSLGGYLALSYALAYPDRVAGIVLLSTGPGFSKVEAREAWNQWVRSHVDADAPNQELLTFHHDTYVLDRLREIEVPVLLFQGERDKRFEAARQVFEARLPDVEVHVLAGAGHNIHLTHSELVGEALLQWLPKVETSYTP